MARPYLGGSTAGIKAVSADVTLEPADSGKKIVVDASAAGNFTITLPATASNKGIEYDIVLGVASNAAAEVLITSDSHIVGGLIRNSNGEVATQNSGASRGFADASRVGERMHIVCDGSKWIILNANSVNAFITVFS